FCMKASLRVSLRSVDHDGYRRRDVARRETDLVVARLHAYRRVQSVAALRGRPVRAQWQAYDRAPFVDVERLVRELELVRDWLRVFRLARSQALLRRGLHLGRDVELVGGGVRVDVVALGYVERDGGLARAARVELRLVHGRHH